MESGFVGRGFGLKGRSAVLTAGFAIIFFSIISVYSQNLVLNGNFGLNGGSFTDWTISHTPGDTNFANYSPMIYNGVPGPGGNNYYARFLNETSGSADILSQDIPTVPGDIYMVSFYAEDGAGHNFTTDFSFGSFSYDLGNAFAIGPGEWWNGWTNFSFTITATQAESDLSFLVQADTQSEFGVTGISVTAVSQPQLQEALVGGKFQVTVTNCTSQVVIQASTNLVNWVNVCTNMAPCAFTDACAMPQRFYRVAMVSQAGQ
jgi:hypothetical protein